MRKGILFTMDAIFAMLIIVLTVVLFTQIDTSSSERTHSQIAANDVLLSLGAIELNELEVNHPWVTDLYTSTPLNENDSVVYAIGVLWALNDSRASNFTFLLNDSLSDTMGIRMRIEGTQIFENSTPNTDTLQSVARQQITGIAQAKPLAGSSASANLKKIRNKRTSSFLYFGGFVGQGNITVTGASIPADGNVTSLIIEMDTQEGADIYINGQFCSFLPAESGASSIEYYDLTNCSFMINTVVDNNIRLVFNSTINDAFVAGGLINVEYTTNELIDSLPTGNNRIYLPGIEGIINLYDGIHIPGTLTSMNAYLHYFADSSGDAENNTFYFNVGNETIYTDDNTTTEQFITFTDVNFTSLDYNQMSNTTVPIRVGFENLTFTTVFSGNADIVFVTDVSGSMRWRMDYTGGGCGGGCGGCCFGGCCGQIRACNDPNLFDDDTERLSLTTCLEKDFFTEMLNFTNNYIGLVSYEDGIDSTLGLQSTYPPLETEVDSYVAGGNTQICTGINEAVDLLDLSTTTLIASQSTWLYNTSYFSSTPPQDGGGRDWYETTYTLESEWESGDTILGSTNGDVYTPTVDTEIGNGLGGAAAAYVDLWDMFADRPEPVDFTSGLNTTANTFGPDAGDDGWDWDRNLYDASTIDMTSHYDPSGASDGVTMDGSGRIQIEIGGPSCSGCGYRDSGAFGVEFEVTQPMWEMIVNQSGVATVSFEYEAFDREAFGGGDETEESVWLKARFGDGTTMNYLGYDLDATGGGSTPGDATNEILWDHDSSVYWHTDNDRGDFDMDGDGDYNYGIHEEDVTAYITGNGTYYLELGAKFDAINGWQVNTEGIRAYYDNVQLSISNHTDNYYFRKSFNVADVTQIGRGVVNVLSDERATVYVNGQVVDTDPAQHQATYWNRGGINIDNSYFQDGTNVVAVHMQNQGGASKFDLELFYTNDSQSQNIFVMTDGEANIGCAQQGVTADLDGNSIPDEPEDDAIQAACDAKEDYGVTVYAVGFSDGAHEPTLQGIADCGGGLFRRSDNASELQDFFDDVAFDILIGSRTSQIVEFTSGSFSDSILYPDSYIDITYDPVVAPPSVGEISIKLQSPRFASCTTDLQIPAGVRVAEAKVTSYSAEHWTDLVTKDGTIVYNLSEYSPNYEVLGDPFLVDLPADLFSTGSNNVSINIGDSPTQANNCSDNNTILYTILFTGATGRSSVVEIADGCTWTIEHEDTTNSTISVPSTYSGANTCRYQSDNYTLGQGAYNPIDAYDVAVYGLLSQLDFDSDGRVFVDFDDNDIEIVVNSVSSIPYLWGPSVVEVDVWQ